jgi:hypothetical protein
MAQVESEHVTAMEERLGIVIQVNAERSFHLEQYEIREGQHTGSIGTGSAATGLAATGPAGTGPVATGPAVTGPAAAGPAATGPGK